MMHIKGLNRGVQTKKFTKEGKTFIFNFLQVEDTTKNGKILIENVQINEENIPEFTETEGKIIDIPVYVFVKNNFKTIRYANWWGVLIGIYRYSNVYW